MATAEELELQLRTLKARIYQGDYSSKLEKNQILYQIQSLKLALHESRKEKLSGE